MKKWFALFGGMIRIVALLLLLSSTVMAGKAGSPSEVARLVKAMELDQLALLGMQLSIERGVKEGKSTPGQLACIKKVDRSTFVQPYVVALTNRLSREEVLDATRFFESPTGEKYLANAVAQFYRAVGVTGNNSPPDLSLSEQKVLLQFAATSAGKKLVGPESFINSPEITSGAAPTIRRVYDSCKAK